MLLVYSARTSLSPSPKHPANTSPLMITVAYTCVIVIDARLLLVLTVNLLVLVSLIQVVVDAD